MLSNLLSSKHKSGVVHLFLANPSRSYSLTEIKETTKCPPKLMLQTVRELSKMGFLITTAKEKVKYYQVDKRFPLYAELLSMIRNKKMPHDLLVRELSKLTDCKAILLTGIFAGRPRIETDILLVGRVSQKKLSKSLKLAEKFAEQEVNYTIMPLAEFEYRLVMSDRFVKNILENHPVVVTDKTKNKNVMRIVQRI
jgi:hypothetical protein